MELFRLIRSKKKLKIQKGRSNNSTKMVKIDETTASNLKELSNLLSIMTLPSINKSRYKWILIRTYYSKYLK
jgi:hypothetical protein